MLVSPAVSIQAEARPVDDDVVARLVDAARRLMWDAGGTSFTVNQVVAAAGSSLKTFYRCFASKDELLVALFEDDARRGAAALAAAVGRRPPPERLRTAVVGLFRFITLDGRLPYAAVLVAEHLRLAGTRPAELREVMQPLVAVFEDELRAAMERGEIRAGDAARDARMLYHLVASHLHALICHQTDDDPAVVAEDLWDFCAAALRPLEAP